MYHMGVVLALIEGGALPSIVSGTSGGAIVAGVLAIHTDEEMRNDIIKPDIAVRYLPDRWFPPLPQQLYNYLKLGCLVDNEAFESCTKRYYGDMTFEEAFRRTGRVVNINISSSSRESGPRGALLLNALTTPHVLVRSAVHASCCLPTVMKPTTLLAKDPDGNVVPFHGGGGSADGVHGHQYMDGSFTADIPRDRLTELFHVTQTVVSQVNPHVVLTMSKHRGSGFSLFHRLESALSADVLHRLQILAKLRLLPAMYGHDIKSIALKQKYTGDVTILPKIGGPQAVLRMVQNPEPHVMAAYIHEGRAAALSKLSHVRHLLRVEQSLENATRLCSALVASLGSPTSPVRTPAWGIPRNHSRSQLLRMRDEACRAIDREAGCAGAFKSARPQTRRQQAMSQAALDRLIAAAEAGELTHPNARTAAIEAYPALLSRLSTQSQQLQQAEERATALQLRVDQLAEVLSQVGAAAKEAVGNISGAVMDGMASPPFVSLPLAASSASTSSPNGDRKPEHGGRNGAVERVVSSPGVARFPPIALSCNSAKDRVGIPGLEGVNLPRSPRSPPPKLSLPAFSAPRGLLSDLGLKPVWACDGAIPSPIAEAERASLEDLSMLLSPRSSDTRSIDTPRSENEATRDSTANSEWVR
mmetsp:Transcript_1895/g.5176  ORF Transcript_1895/g.5176 Transcript_1895/m.5176 type:complete len:643 (+) Transcript_1895:1098-3026(+)